MSADVFEIDIRHATQTLAWSLRNAKIEGENNQIGNFEWLLHYEILILKVCYIHHYISHTIFFNILSSFYN